MQQIIFLAIAGALGALGRYGLAGLAQRVTNTGFPVGTLAVNILGSLLIGFIMQVGLNTDIIPRAFRVAATVGFLGAFTTFSAFSYETVGYIEDGAWLAAVLNISANVGFCVAATLVGVYIGRTTLGGA